MNAAHRLARVGLFSPEFPDAEAMHQGLAQWNRRRLAVQTPTPGWSIDLNNDFRMMRIEGAFIEGFRMDVAPLIAGVPSDADGFIRWFEDLKQSGPGQYDPLFAWIEASAGRDSTIRVWTRCS